MIHAQKIRIKEPEPKGKKPKTKRIKPNIIKKDDKEFIVLIDKDRYPCSNCLEELRQDCKKDLEQKLSIEFYRANENCICIDWDSFHFEPE